jgi:signal transduction histidine kinase
VHQSLELYRVLKDRDEKAAEAKMELARELAKNTLDSTRNLSMALRESEVEEGLGPALSKLLGTTIPSEVRYAVSVEGDEALVPPHVGEQLFLILREAVRNAATHSGASQITVELDVSPERAIGRVDDDGRGFDPEAVGNGRTGGLRSMRERASLLGGSFGLTPESRDRGTRVEVVVPLAPPGGEL